MSNENFLIGVIAFLLFIIGFIYAYEGNTTKLEPINYESDIKEIRSSNFIRFVYIGSDDCGFCNEDTHNKIKFLKEALREFSQNNEYKFISTGVAVDTYARNGIEYLNKTTPYDEIVSGASWFNLGLNHYIWNHSANSKPAVPQVIITYVEFNVSSNNLGGILGIEKNEKILKRYVGVLELENLNKIVRNESDEAINQKLGLDDI